MKKFFWIIDAGHGGLNADGAYVTPGKRSTPEMGEPVYYEGVGNEVIASQLAGMLWRDKTPFALTRTSWQDEPLRKRISTGAVLASLQDLPAALISIHSNAGGGTGFEVFTSPGQDLSDKLAECMVAAFAEEFPDEKIRKDTSDGDSDKEAKFTMLVGHEWPAVLTENFFMDNHKDIAILRDPSTAERIARFHFNAIKAFENML